MSLRAKLLCAQIPLVAALLLLAVVATFTTAALGSGAHGLLSDNYRSVLAAQAMKEALERIDSGVLFAAVGRRDDGVRQVAENRPRFERELAAQERNITEPGEADVTSRLRSAWTAYTSSVDRFLALPRDADLDGAYFAELSPGFRAVKAGADEILTINHDAMVRRSDAAAASARRLETFLTVVALAGCVLGIVVSALMTTRLLRPLSVLGQTAKRIGEGDLAVRARVAGRDEIARLAGEFNAMAERLEAYRQSSLGELLEAQSAMQAAIDSLPDPVVVMALDQQVLRVNASAERLLHLDPDASGAAALAGVPEPLRESIERVRKHVLGGHGAYVPRGLEDTVRVPTADGDVHLLPRATPVYSMEGAVVATTIVLQDVSRVVRSDERRNDLVATVAHEFRTPLTSLRMAIHLCTEEAVGPLTGKQADLLFAARDDCERLQRIVDELLDVSRIQSGRVPLALRTVEVAELVDAAVEGQRRAADERGVRVVAEVLPDAGRLDVDRDRLLLALGNLVANAIRHSPRGGEVVVRTKRSADALRLEVADHGEGIAPEHREAVFERNFQVPGSAAGGAGLGLFIARETVQAHGGRIGVESDVGRGSTFWIELPAGGAPA